MSDDALAKLLRAAPGWFEPPWGEVRGIYGNALRPFVERNGLRWEDAAPQIAGLVRRSGGTLREEQPFTSRSILDVLMRRPAREGVTDYYELPAVFFDH